GELLELDQGEVGFDAGGVAVHYQRDGPSRRDAGGLRVAITEPLAQFEHAVALAPGGLDEVAGQAAASSATGLLVNPPYSSAGTSWAARRWLRTTRSMASWLAA